MQKGGWVYILASKRNGTLYIGVTSNILRRQYLHQQELTGGFTARYGVKQLVHVEWHDRIETAIQREKTMKHWPRAWKIRLIETGNPSWRDLSEDLMA